MSIILIVDDDPSARETLTAMLEGQDYQLELATNGPEALQTAERVQPDLILLLRYKLETLFWDLKVKIELFLSIILSILFI